MNNAANTVSHYEVRYSTKLDRPELRGSTLPLFAAGSYFQDTIRCARQGDAVRCFEEILGGYLDFASEYVCRVDVVRVYRPRADGSGHRGHGIVRRNVRRTRAGVVEEAA